MQHCLPAPAWAEWCAIQYYRSNTPQLARVMYWLIKGFDMVPVVVVEGEDAPRVIPRDSYTVVYLAAGRDEVLDWIDEQWRARRRRAA